MTAEPIATPLVIALVVLPTEFEIIHHVAGTFFKAGQFTDAVGVVSDRAEGIHRDGVAGQGQHADARERDAIQHGDKGIGTIACATKEEDRGENRDGDDQHGIDRQLIAQRQPGQNVGGRTGLRGARGFLDRRKWVEVKYSVTLSSTMHKTMPAAVARKGAHSMLPWASCI